MALNFGSFFPVVIDEHTVYLDERLFRMVEPTQLGWATEDVQTGEKIGVVEH